MQCRSQILPFITRIIACCAIWTGITIQGVTAYTFTDTTGRQFEGEILSLTESTVTVKRAADGRTFTVERNRFSSRDQAYFESWRPEDDYRAYGLRQGEPIRALPRQLRVDLIWERGEFNHFEIQRAPSSQGPWEQLENPTSVFHVFSDWIGSPNQTFHYRVKGSIRRGERMLKEGDWTEPVSATTLPYDREKLVEEVQEAGIRFFLEEAHPVSGLAPEGQPGWGNVCAVGSTGMGMANIIVAVHRGFVSQEEGSELAARMLRFLATKAPRPRGALGHWMDGATGEIKNFGKQKDAVDLVETAFLIQGAILLREYFNGTSQDEQDIRK